MSTFTIPQEPASGAGRLGLTENDSSRHAVPHIPDCEFVKTHDGHVHVATAAMLERGDLVTPFWPTLIELLSMGYTQVAANDLYNRSEAKRQLGRKSVPLPPPVFTSH